MSGLVDVSQLLGFARRSIPGATPIVVYQHESQLVYPTASGAVDPEASLRNWQSWCAADAVLFNSQFHRNAVAAELPAFLEHQPDDDQRPFLDEVMSRFEVMPVGLDLDWLEAAQSGSATEGVSGREPQHADGPVVLWPHRWEPDKDPDAFLSALRKLRGGGSRARLILAGGDPLVPSATKEQILEEFADWVDAVGPFDTEGYRSHLLRSDIVVSCARHDFFGVGIAEAVAAGARPLLVDDLAYPELIDERWHGDVLYPRGRFGSAFADAVRRVSEGLDVDRALAASVRERFGWSTIAPQLDERLEDLVVSGS